MQLILKVNIQFDVLAGFVFCATLFLYAIHRIVGISKLHEFLEMERYATIAKYKHHITFYAFIAGAGSCYYFWYLPNLAQLMLVIPALISFGYVLPFLTGKRRLRDLNHLKIFLVAIVWAWITVLLPALIYPVEHSFSIIMILMERMLFIFAITLPFDIRDLKVDKENKVKTIPASIGIAKTKFLAGMCLLVALLLAGINLYFGWYSLEIFIGLTISFLLTFWLIYRSDKITHDYFYTGLMDGTMILQFVLIYICVENVSI